LPDRHFIAPQNRHFRHSDGGVNGTYNALPFDRKACLLTNRFGDAGAFFRRSVFVDTGLRYDQVLISYEDWALWMDLADRDLPGETVPRVLYDYRVRDDSMMAQDGWPNHPALMGWLIQHHYPKASQGERDILTTLFQNCGQSIARVAAGQPDHVPAANKESQPKSQPKSKPKSQPKPQPQSADAQQEQPAPTPPEAVGRPTPPSGGKVRRLVRKLFG
jgi:hypothetical protein